MANQQQYAFNWDDLKVFLAIARQGTLRGGGREYPSQSYDFDTTFIGYGRTCW